MGRSNYRQAKPCNLQLALERMHEPHCIGWLYSRVEDRVILKRNIIQLEDWRILPAGIYREESNPAYPCANSLGASANSDTIEAWGKD
jgi:hypothetical protein